MSSAFPSRDAVACSRATVCASLASTSWSCGQYVPPDNLKPSSNAAKVPSRPWKSPASGDRPEMCHRTSGWNTSSRASMSPAEKASMARLNTAMSACSVMGTSLSPAQEDAREAGAGQRPRRGVIPRHLVGCGRSDGLHRPGRTPYAYPCSAAMTRARPLTARADRSARPGRCRRAARAGRNPWPLRRRPRPPPPMSYGRCPRGRVRGRPGRSSAGSRRGRPPC